MIRWVSGEQEIVKENFFFFIKFPIVHDKLFNLLIFILITCALLMMFLLISCMCKHKQIDDFE
jgi:hypothetical protein